MDIHKRFAEVAVHENGRVGRLGRVEVDELERFAESLRSDDHVIESTSQTWTVVELIGRHVGRVTVSNPMREKHGTAVRYTCIDPSVYELCETVCGALRRQLDALEDILAPTG